MGLASRALNNNSCVKLAIYALRDAIMPETVHDRTKVTIVQ